MTAVDHEVERVLALTPLQEGTARRERRRSRQPASTSSRWSSSSHRAVLGCQPWPGPGTPWWSDTRSCGRRFTGGTSTVRSRSSTVTRRCRSFAPTCAGGRPLSGPSCEQDRGAASRFDRAPPAARGGPGGAPGRRVGWSSPSTTSCSTAGASGSSWTRSRACTRDSGRVTGSRLAPAADFGDFVTWLGQQDPRAAEAFWRAELGDHEGAPSVARRLGGHGRAPEHRELVLELTEGEAVGAGRAARAARVTLNTLVLGAWAVVLGAELRANDVVVGTVVSGREAPVRGIESMVGLCINTIPVRIRLPARATRQGLARRVAGAAARVPRAPALRADDRARMERDPSQPSALRVDLRLREPRRRTATGLGTGLRAYGLPAHRDRRRDRRAVSPGPLRHERRGTRCGRAAGEAAACGARGAGVRHRCGIGRGRHAPRRGARAAPCSRARQAAGDPRPAGARADRRQRPRRAGARRWRARGDVRRAGKRSLGDRRGAARRRCRAGHRRRDRARALCRGGGSDPRHARHGRRVPAARAVAAPRAARLHPRRQRRRARGH